MMHILKIVVLIITLSFIFSCKKDDEEPKVENAPPVIQVKGDPENLTLQLGNQVSVDASESKDPEGKDLVFQWELISQPEGSAITLENPKSDKLSFKPTHAGQYKIKLICSDG